MSENLNYSPEYENNLEQSAPEKPEDNYSEPIEPDQTDKRKLSPEEIQSRKDHLKTTGFSDDFINHLAEKRPSLYSIDHIDIHLSGLSERGFSNPTKMIESSPSILGYSFDNIDSKTKGLSERGFSNPTKMIESSPSVLGLAFENIDRRLRLFNRLITLYDLPIDPIEAMEKTKSLWTAKFDKLIVVSRILRDYKVPKDEIEQRISQVLVVNLEDLLVALKDKKETETISTLTKRARAIKKRHLSKAEKRNIIKEDLESLQREKAKITKRYFRGYPEKK